jgi:D-alanine-D-alanine ligase
MASLTRVIDPEDLDVRIKERVTAYALKAFQAIGCSGVSRLDFIVDLASGGIYFNEINPIPGSLSFYLWAKSKPPVTYTKLIRRMIERAIEEKRTRTGLVRDTGFRALFKG